MVLRRYKYKSTTFTFLHRVTPGLHHCPDI